MKFLTLVLLVTVISSCVAGPWGGSEAGQRGYAVEDIPATASGGGSGYAGSPGSSYGPSGLRGGGYASSSQSGYGAGGRQGGGYAGGTGYGNKVEG
ncbi:hypothetical protein FHG87_008483 [Trinorchestia longiramus]|nr:hypothetical protein FHG87_008483 [Trinorchestia longiramus]